jgi:serine/threonine protein kinase
LNLGFGLFSAGAEGARLDSDNGDTGSSGCSETSPDSPHDGSDHGLSREFEALESDLLQGPGLLARAMSVDVLTSNYKAPEVYLRYSESSRLCEYNEKVDIWSVGCVLGMHSFPLSFFRRHVT